MRKVLSMVCEDKGMKRSYFIDDARTLDILYVAETNTYVVSFKQFHKRMAISTKHFHITGITYDK